MHTSNKRDTHRSAAAPSEPSARKAQESYSHVGRCRLVSAWNNLLVVVHSSHTLLGVEVSCISTREMQQWLTESDFMIFVFTWNSAEIPADFQKSFVDHYDQG